MTVAQDGTTEELEVCAVFGGDRVALSLVGDVDMLTAPDFAAVLEAVIDRGYRSIVLDLAGPKFMGAAGLGVLARASARIGPSAASLTLRSAPAMLMRLLDICDLTDIVAFEQLPLRLECPVPLPSASRP